MRSSTSTRVAALALAAACGAACTIGDAGSSAPAPSAAASSSPSASPSVSRPDPAQEGRLRVALEQAVKAVTGQASIAVAGNGRVVVAGTSAGLPAWSTSKVPLVMAALTKTPRQGMTAPMRAAIINSDNAAAESIWSSLGTADQAAAAMTQVLRAGKDEVTVVPTKKTRAEYSVFGQTQWNDGPAATFASRIPCSPEGPEVLGLMREVDADQRWGASTVPGAEWVGVKGGWGPGNDGRYVVRQLAVIRTTRGYTGLMMTVRPDDGSLASGRTALTGLGAVVRAQLGALPAGEC